MIVCASVFAGASGPAISGMMSTSPLPEPMTVFTAMLAESVELEPANNTSVAAPAGAKA